MGAKTSIYLLALAALALAANVTYVTTPSGKIHITYVDNGTYIVVNINNNKVITANVKLNVTVGGEQYYLRVVGFATLPAEPMWGPWWSMTACRSPPSQTAATWRW